MYIKINDISIAKNLGIFHLIDTSIDFSHSNIKWLYFVNLDYKSKLFDALARANKVVMGEWFAKSIKRIHTFNKGFISIRYEYF